MTNENDWVTQDVVPPRNKIDQFHYIHSEWETEWLFAADNWDRLQVKHGWTDDDGSVLQVRCRRKDHPMLGKVGSQMVSQDELNAQPRTRAWTFGTPAQTGHFLFSYKDPAIFPQEIFANTILSSTFKTDGLWFIYLGQTSDFADPVVPKAKYTLLLDLEEPYVEWFRRPEDIQERLNNGWIIIKEQERNVPEWDR